MEAGALRAPAPLSRISVTASLLRLRSDEQLVAAFRAGNDAAFAVMHDRYRQRLFSYTRQMLGGSRQDAEDALQDVFLRAYSALRSSERPVSLRAWLYRVAHNRCIDHLRKPVAPQLDVFETSRKPLYDPIAEAERREDLRRLVEDVARLPEQQRSALLMREIDGLSYAELGEALGVTLPAVKSLLVRARIGLVEAVEARETACADIRSNLAEALDRGVRASGRTRRHLRYCDACTAYRTQLRGVSRGLGALAPAAGLLPTVAKLLGLSGAGSGAAAGAGGGAAAGGAAAGGGAITTVAGGTAAKVAAIVAGAALTAGGAVEVRDRIARPAAPPASASPAPVRAHAAADAPASSPATLRHRPGVAARSRADAREPRAAPGALPADDTAISPHIESADPATRADELTGGATAPDEETGFGHGVDGLTPVTDATPAGDGAGAPPVSSGTGTAEHPPAPTVGSGTDAPATAPSSGGAKWAGGRAAGAGS